MFIMASQISTGALQNSIHCIKIETVLKYLSVVSGHWQKPGNRIAKIQEQVICFDDDDDDDNNNNNNNNNNNKNDDDDGNKFWIDVQWGIVLFHGVKDPLQLWLAIPLEMLS